MGTASRIDAGEPSMSSYLPGDYVKVEFSDEASGVGEWMWVIVERCDDARKLVFGRLDSEPLNESGKAKLGSQLAVAFSRIRERRSAADWEVDRTPKPD
jgi:hypothetical protein